MTQGFTNEWQPGDPKDIDGKQSPEQMHLRSMLEPQEQWNRVHAQLLKSVADAQAKLLAGINETCDKLERMDVNLKVLIANTHEAVRNSHGTITGRVDAIGAILAELLTVRRPGPAKRNQRKRRA